jgi:hypothetical protein
MFFPVAEEQYIKHLQLVQQVVERLARNSFAVKGWSITLIGAILALTNKESTPDLVKIAALPAVMFWVLDAYFVHKERLFRALHEAIGAVLRGDAAAASVKLWSMSTKAFQKEHPGWLRVMFSESLLAFHGTMTVMVVAYLIFRRSNGS